MTYKCALAGVPYGGGKAVLIADPKHPKTKEMLIAYAKRVALLGGNFYTGEDVGINQNDIAIMSSVCPYINGRPGIGGSPGKWAALGVLYAIQSCLKSVFGNEEIRGRAFAVKGLGSVGMELCRLLHEAGGVIFAADINSEKTSHAALKFPGIKIVPPSEIHKQQVDVYSPCALGGEFTEAVIEELRCRIVCGAANNQLTEERLCENFFQKN